jgi:hypothetical protein
MSPRLLLSLLFLAVTPCLCETTDTTCVSGYVTRLGSPSDFDLNGRHVRASEKTVQIKQPSSKAGSSPAPDQLLNLHLFDQLKACGPADSKAHDITATRIEFEPRGHRSVSGTAIIDSTLPLPAGANPSTDHMVRADGYQILITAKTRRTFEKPLRTSADIHVNVWITYEGTQQPDGTIIAETADFEKNTTSRSLDRQREQWEYDPNAIPDDAHQSGVSKAFRGNDPRQYPPHKDPAMQARVDAIGAKLVPKYQVDFPYTEETRLDVRFYLIDAPKWRDAMPLPSGIVLVPYQLVGWMQNDSQLAAFLADKVACLLEKQPVFLPATDADFAVDAAEVALVAVPVAEAVYQLVGIPLGIDAITQTYLHREQRDRVSIALMHDAGYDVMQAPIAWWLLSSKMQKDISDIPEPARAKYLYQYLGQTWANQLATTYSAPAPSAPQ